jgi:hypothetical protein
VAASVCTDGKKNIARITLLSDAPVSGVFRSTGLSDDIARLFIFWDNVTIFRFMQISQQSFDMSTQFESAPANLSVFQEPSSDLGS